MTSAVIVVPPLLKYLAGPLLGPALLAGVGRAAGVDVRVVDLNATWLRGFPDTGRATDGVVGDHARPPGRFRIAAAGWFALVEAAASAVGHTRTADDVAALRMDHDEVAQAASRADSRRKGVYFASDVVTS